MEGVSCPALAGLLLQGRGAGLQGSILAVVPQRSGVQKAAGTAAAMIAGLLDSDPDLWVPHTMAM